MSVLAKAGLGGALIRESHVNFLIMGEGKGYQY
jgi:hypothetical protein